MKLNFRTVFAFLLLILVAGCKDEAITPKRGLLYPSADKNTVFVGEKINFSDYSTRVMSRQWTFEGGSPASATENTVEILYGEAGTYSATLEVTYLDGTTDTEIIQVTVNNEYVPLVTVNGPTYVFYSEDQELVQDHPSFTLSRSGTALPRFVSNAFEGNEAISMTIDPDATNTFAMLLTQKVGDVDLTEFRNGYLNLAIKSTSQDPIHIRIEGGANSHVSVGPNDYGFERDGTWRFISIPMDDVLSQITTEDGKMALLGGFNQFRLRSHTGQFNPATWDFSVDFIFFSNEIPIIRE